MPPTTHNCIRLLKKTGIIALVEGVKAVPGVGSLVVVEGLEGEV